MRTHCGAISAEFLDHHPQVCIDGFRFVGSRNDENNTGKFFLADHIRWQISTSQKHHPEGVVFERKKLAKIEAKIVRAIVGV